MCLYGFLISYVYQLILLICCNLSFNSTTQTAPSPIAYCPLFYLFCSFTLPSIYFWFDCLPLIIRIRIWSSFSFQIFVHFRTLQDFGSWLEKICILNGDRGFASSSLSTLYPIVAAFSLCQRSLSPALQFHSTPSKPPTPLCLSLCFRYPPFSR